MGIAPHFPQQGEDVLIRSPFPNGFDDGHAPFSGRNIQVPMFHGVRLPVSIEVVSQPRITPEGKAQADSKAQSACGGCAFREACNPPAADHRGSDGDMKPLLPAHLRQGLLEFPVEIHTQADGLVEQDRHLPLGIGCGFFRPVAVSLRVLLIVPDPMLQQFDQLVIERKLGRMAVVMVVVMMIVVVVMAHGNLLSEFGNWCLVFG